MDYSLAMNHRTSYHELKKMMAVLETHSDSDPPATSCRAHTYCGPPPRITPLSRTQSSSFNRRPRRKSKHKASKSGPDGLLRSVSALSLNLNLTQKLSDLNPQFPDIPESPQLSGDRDWDRERNGVVQRGSGDRQGLRLKASHSELTPDKASSQKPYAKRYSLHYDSYDSQHGPHHQMTQMNQMIHRMQTYPLCGGGKEPIAMPSMSTMQAMASASVPLDRWCRPKSPVNPHIMNPNYMVTNLSNLNRRKSSLSKSRIFGHFGSKRASKRLSQETCKSCIILQNEVLKLRNEREVLERKMTMSVHGLVLQKELVRKQDVELRLLRRKLQAMYALQSQPTQSQQSPAFERSQQSQHGRHSGDGNKSFSPSLSPSTTSRSVGVENEQYFVEDFIMDNELEMFSDSPREHRPDLADDGFAFAFPKTDDEKSMEIPSLFAMGSIELEPRKSTIDLNGSGPASGSGSGNGTGTGTGRNGKRRGAQTEFPILDGALVTSSGSTISQKRAFGSCHSKKSSVVLAQSVTDDVAHSVHSVDDPQDAEDDEVAIIGPEDDRRKHIKHSKFEPVHDGEHDPVHEEEDEEKSASLGYDHYDEEYMEMMPIMEGSEGVTMTNAGNPRYHRSPETSEPSMKDSDEVKVSGLKHPALLSPHSVDPGMDDDLLNRLTANTPTPLIQRRSSDNISLFDLDRISSPDDLTDDDMECHNHTERWKLFQSSELAQLFSVLQYRTYCYCEREKRTSVRLKQMKTSDPTYWRKMEQLHSMAIAEELLILQPILHLETLSSFLRQLVETERALDILFNPHQQCHDVVYQSIARHLKDSGILFRTQPVFNWAVSDYQSMWKYQQVLHEQFQQFLIQISRQLHDSNIYCCHKDDFDDDNKYRHTVTPKTSMISAAKRTKEDVNQHYRRRFGKDFQRSDTFFSAPKNSSRTFFKVFYDFDGNVSHLTDFLRASFVFDNFEDLYNALFVIHEFCKKHGPKTTSAHLGRATTSMSNPSDSETSGLASSPGPGYSTISTEGVGILKYKNSFLAESKLNNGWRQIVLNVPLCGGGVDIDGRAPSVPIICEIQLHFCLFWQFKDSTHRMYEISRLFKIRDHDTGKSKNLAMECAKQFYGK